MISVDVSVVIPAYNEEKYLAQCLHSLVHQVDSPRHEIVVVDNGSRDSTAAIARAFGAQVINERQRGVGQARRTGFAAAQAPIIASTDADCAPAADWLNCIWQTFQEEPDLVAVGGYALFLDGPLYIRLAPQLNRRFNALSSIGRLLGRQPLSTQNLAVRRHAYEAVGGFNPAIVSPLTLDDVDLTLRLSKVGPVRVRSDLIVWTSARRYMREPLKTFWYRAANYAAYAVHGQGLFADHQSNIR